ncbi:MAG TPA: DUF4113 domain-containing protein, partial [Chitinophagaceae bacterium]|jgi:DNA polymerase V|nr:DUF4113 domain-containing protein [Chitinophagaceae bacterium]
MPDEWIRKNMTVVVQRLIYELRGINAIKWEDIPPPKKNICTSRSFGKLLTSIKELQQPIASHATSCANKLRKEQSCATKLHVFIMTNPFNGLDKQYEGGITIPLNVATNNSTELIKFAMWGLREIYKDGFNYQKCGVMVLDLVPQTCIQLGLFDMRDRAKDQQLMKAIDRTNTTFGKDAVRYASHGYCTHWKLRTAHLSPKYTTRIDELMVVKS